VFSCTKRLVNAIERLLYDELAYEVFEGIAEHVGLGVLQLEIDCI